MPSSIYIDGAHFKDRLGRTVILRGLNLGGDCKVPSAPNGHIYLPTDFSDHRSISFVGRPAPLEEIDRHLTRIAHWGFNCLRLLTTWEAVEHSGPGQFDEQYLDYYSEVCRRAGRFGLQVIVDFHQDVWSRMTGGDGAPGWTLEAAGLDLTKFHAADAAHLMQCTYDHRKGGHQDSYSRLGWGGNFRRPANGIIWTCFLAGADFAPTCRVGMANIQHFLQDHYLGSMRAVAERIAHLDNVIGFDTLNEPGTGYIGKELGEPITRRPGEAWPPLDGLAVASGHRRKIPLTAPDGRFADQYIELNRAKTSIWLPGHHDPFREEGAWDLNTKGEPVALRSDYFTTRRGRNVDIENDYLAPFFHRVANTVRDVNPDFLIFAEIDPLSALAGRAFPEDCPDRTVNASHWYDVFLLVTKRFSTDRSVDILSGRGRGDLQTLEESYVEGLSALKANSDRLNGGAPTLIGEFGVPYDWNSLKPLPAGQLASGDKTFGAHRPPRST